MKRNILTALFALAGTPDESSKSTIRPAAPPTARSGDIGVTVLNNYNTRGIIVESKGVIFQPTAPGRG